MTREHVWRQRLVTWAVGGVLLGWALTAPAQSRVSVYTALDEHQARDIYKVFEQETGVRVDWVRLSTGETVARLEAERQNPQASLWVSGTDAGHIDARLKGLTAPYRSPATDAIPARFRDRDGYWTGLYASPLTFAVNTSLLKRYGLKAPASWADLLRPEYKGHIQLSNPGSSGTAYNVITTVIFLWGEEKGFEYLKQLHRNIAQYPRSGSAPWKAAALGETVIGIGYASGQIEMKTQGYPIEIVVPTEGTGYEISPVSLVKNGPQPDAARKLYDWLLGRRAAELYATYFIVPFVEVPVRPGAIPLADLKTVSQDHLWAAEHRQRLIDRWTREVYTAK